MFFIKNKNKKKNNQQKVDTTKVKIPTINDKEKLTEEYIIVGFLSWAKYGYEIYENIEQYPRWTSYKLHLDNPKLKHQELVKNGYLIPASTEFTLGKCKVSQLKEILNDHNLNANGKKDDLIERIVNNVDIYSIKLPKYYVLSAKGESFLKDHEDLVSVYYNKYDISEYEYITTKATMTDYCKVNDVFWRIFQIRYDNYFKSQDWGLLRNVECNRAIFLQEEKKYKDALYHFILVTYYDLSGCGNNNRIESKENAVAAPSILNNIHELGEYYDEIMIDRCYKNYLPHHYLNKEVFRTYIKKIIKNDYT